MSDTYDTVQVTGLRLEDGQSFRFEDEVRHFGEALQQLGTTGIKYNINKIVIKHRTTH